MPLPSLLRLLSVAFCGQMPYLQSRGKTTFGVRAYAEFLGWNHLLEINKKENCRRENQALGCFFFKNFFQFCLPAWRSWWFEMFDMWSFFLLGTAFQHMLCNCSSIYPVSFSRKGNSTDCSPERQKWTLWVNADIVFFVHAKLTENYLPVHGNS